MTTFDLPTYVSISEAVKRYKLGREALARLVEAGRVRAVEVDGDMAVAEEDVDAANTEAVIQAIEHDSRLEGCPIRVTEAAEKYGVSHTNLSRWADAGYIRIIERAPKRLLLDEADVKYATEVFKQARRSTGSYVRAGWVLKRILEQRRS
jgi:predicted site-specific integrase-resolvase